MKFYVIGMGSSLGDRVKFLRNAVKGLSTLGEIVKVSPIYESNPVGGVAKNNFLNAAVLLRTPLDPGHLMGFILEVEKSLGRLRQKRWDDRTIDLDILLAFDDRKQPILFQEDAVQIPHQELRTRMFAWRPTCDLVGGWQSPWGNQRIEQIQSDSTDSISVLEEAAL